MRLAWMLVLAPVAAHAQWNQQTSNTTAELRGIAAVSASVAWASGTRGTVLRTTDGGTTWRADTVPGASTLDFRDVEAVDSLRAWVLSIGNGGASRIYATIDGGRTWALRFANTDTSAFFDCLAFWDAQNGLAVSDPVGGHFVLRATADGGRTWTPVAPPAAPAARDGEGAFAASGTCLVAKGTSDAWIATAFGARVLRSSDRGRSWQSAPTPLAAGAPPKGVFSVAFRDARRGVALGGDYEHPADTVGTAAFTIDGGALWLRAEVPPRGYRSGAAWVPETRPLVVAVGTSGSDYSLDGGRSWAPLDQSNLNAVSFAADGAGWAVGPKGRIMRWTGLGDRRGWR